MSRDLLTLPDAAPGGAFALVKLYADCVAPSGEAAILYAGRIAWHGLSLALSGVSFFASNGPTSESWSLSGGDASHDGNQVLWCAGESHLVAQASTPGFEDTLLAGDDGGVGFHCLVPDGTVEVAQGSRVLIGRGYAERLELTIPPWALPIDALRWGRFTSAEEQIVWIEWRGARPLARVYRAGTASPGAVVHRDSIDLPGAPTLLLGERRVLRAGRLGGMRGAIARLLVQIPELAGIHETKWLRLGRMESAGQTVAQGWVIDEEVTLR